MNENLNTDPTEEPRVNENLDMQQKKISLINSLFFSTTTIIIIGIIFLLSMFISGWYIFTIKDRESDLIKAKEWVDGHQTIINSAKENQNKLNALILDVNDAVAEKRILLVELEDKKNDLKSIENDYNKLIKELELNRTELMVLQENMAKAYVTISSLNKEIPNLEMERSSLNAKITDMELKVKKKQNDLTQKENDFMQLEGKFEMLQGQIMVQTNNLKTINNVNSDFLIVQKRLQDAADKIESNEQKTAANLKLQISELEKHTQTFVEQVDDLKAINSLVRNAGTEINDLNKDLKGDLTDLNNSIVNIKSTSETIDNLSNNFQKSETQFENAAKSISSSGNNFSKKIEEISEEITELTEKYKRAIKNLAQLNSLIDESEKTITSLDRQTEKFQESIDEKSIEELKTYINEISNELIDLNKQIKILRDQTEIKFKG